MGRKSRKKVMKRMDKMSACPNYLVNKRLIKEGFVSLRASPISSIVIGRGQHGGTSDLVLTRTDGRVNDNPLNETSRSPLEGSKFPTNGVFEINNIAGFPENSAERKDAQKLRDMIVGNRHSEAVISCGCINDDPEIKKEVQKGFWMDNKYFSVTIPKFGGNKRDASERFERQYKWVPIDWIQQALPVCVTDDAIPMMKQCDPKGKNTYQWMTENEFETKFQEKQELHGKLDPSIFLMDKPYRLACMEDDDKYEITTPKSVDVAIKKYLNDTFPDLKDQTDHICLLRKNVPSLWNFKLGSKEVKKGDEIPLTDIDLNKIKGMERLTDFGFVDPDDVDPYASRVGYQCRATYGKKNADFAVVVMDSSISPTEAFSTVMSSRDYVTPEHPELMRLFGHKNIKNFQDMGLVVSDKSDIVAEPPKVPSSKAVKTPEKAEPSPKSEKTPKTKEPKKVSKEPKAKKPKVEKTPKVQVPKVEAPNELPSDFEVDLPLSDFF